MVREFESHTFRQYDLITLFFITFSGPGRMVQAAAFQAVYTSSILVARSIRMATTEGMTVQ